MEPTELSGTSPALAAAADGLFAEDLLPMQELARAETAALFRLLESQIGQIESLFRYVCTGDLESAAADHERQDVFAQTARVHQVLRERLPRVEQFLRESDLPSASPLDDIGRRLQQCAYLHTRLDRLCADTSTVRGALQRTLQMIRTVQEQERSLIIARDKIVAADPDQHVRVNASGAQRDAPKLSAARRRAAEDREAQWKAQLQQLHERLVDAGRKNDAVDRLRREGRSELLQGSDASSLLQALRRIGEATDALDPAGVPIDDVRETMRQEYAECLRLAFHEVARVRLAAVRRTADQEHLPYREFSSAMGQWFTLRKAAKVHYRVHQEEIDRDYEDLSHEEFHRKWLPLKKELDQFLTHLDGTFQYLGERHLRRTLQYFFVELGRELWRKCVSGIRIILTSPRGSSTTDAVPR
ncbi:MAG: hypothetical protein Greene041619_1124 [Candidatus Peregrinibacteria bacterium Greene0416_19]|nr:MAG: hypothetical protein Greene041619_1124 [Candidatus Peregrinibacteria bacterium Greene0416_19]